MRGVVATEPLVEIDYAAAVDAASLIAADELTDPTSTRLLIAAVVGPVRLIDNAPAVPVAAVPAPVAHRREARQLERIS
jgi:pantothenate synthetase